MESKSARSKKAEAKLIGQRFSRLLVVAYADRNRQGYIRWICKCDCGNTKTIVGGSLTAGLTTSCGCAQKEAARKYQTTHAHQRGPKVQDLTGQKFARLTVQSIDERDTRKGTRWLCLCDCGNASTVLTECLRGGNTKSCGCLQREKFHEMKMRLKPGRGVPRLEGWSNWKCMIQRCYNHNNVGYSAYGGRGIRVCEFLRVSHRNMLDLIGLKPSSKHSIDRFPNKAGHYSCGSCADCLRLGLPKNIRWATQRQQNLNTRRNHLMTINGVTQSITEWSEQTGISTSTLGYRSKNGYDPLKPSPGAVKKT